MSTSIEWTHEAGKKGETWNPIRARHRVTGKLGWFCIHASAGCVNCYAEKMNAWRGNGAPYTAPALKDVEVFLDEETLAAPLHWKAPRTIFVCSMTDLFGEWVQAGWIVSIFEVMRRCPQHTFIVLTKRAKLMCDWMGVSEHGTMGRPLPNVRLGVSVEDQPNADARIPDLLATPAAVRFLSVEPLLGPVHLRGLHPEMAPGFCVTIDGELWHKPGGCKLCRPGLDWIIVGGESGPGARPCDLAWIRSVVQQAKAAGVPTFVKQLGAHVHSEASCWREKHCTDRIGGRLIADPKGGDPAEWPEDLRDVRQFP